MVQGAAPVAAPERRPPEPRSEGERPTTGYEERAPVPRRTAPTAPQRPGSAPDIALGQGPAGRETLSAIADELVAEPATGVRARRHTLGFEDGPAEPAREPAPQITAAPQPAGRDTLAALGRELEDKLGASEPESGTQPRSTEALEVFEMVTFVVRGPELSRLSSQQARRDFVAERLLQRLPVASIDKVDRIDVTPWTVRGTVIVRVWCRVPEA